ncbi:MAG: hypothetical protein K2I90_13040 [Odoribacter sp.]|nr:hypothetical protein [Odoribacter sp.]
MTETETEERAKPKGGKSGASVKSVLEGSLLAEKLRQNIWYVLFVAVLGIWYITNGYSTEKLHRERVALEKEVKDLRFESLTRAADLMFIRKQSEVIKRIKDEGLDLQESKEPPVKLYRK